MKYLLILIIYFQISLVHAIDIVQVNTSCEDQLNCDQLQNTFKSLKRDFVDESHINDTIKLYVANEGIKSLNYELHRQGKDYTLFIKAQQKSRVAEVEDIQFVGEGHIELPSVLPIRRDDFYDERKVNQTVKIIQEVAKEKGYPLAQVEVSKKDVSSGVNLKFIVNLGEPILVNKINITSKSEYLKKLTETIIGEYYKKPLDLQKIRSELEGVKQLFHQYGYYLADIDLKTKVIDSQQVILFINIKNTRSYVYYIRGLEVMAVDEMKSYLSSSLIGFKREMNEDNVVLTIKEKLNQEGFKESEIQVVKKKHDTNKGETVIQYDVNIFEGDKVKIKSVEFKGSSFFSEKDLLDLFYENGSGAIKAGVHDESFYDKFTATLRELFIQKGFVSVFIEKPFVKYDKDQKTVEITYRIREGIRSKVKEFNLTGVEGELKNKVMALFTNKKDQYFNPISFQEELAQVDDLLKNEGYYYARVTNLNNDNLVRYDEDNSSVLISINVETGLKLFVGDIIIIGNNMTRKILIKRELQFEKGDLVTIDSIERSQVALLSLGIFSSVQIQPVSRNRSKTDILVFVREKDFGTIEIAPGIRTDLGLKVSTTINYNNIDGMNKRITFKGSVNQRLNLYQLDPIRRKTSSSLVEYDTAVNYSENDIFHYEDVDFNTQISKSRRRFYSFDADIQRLTLRVSKDFTTWFNGFVKYQIETISQFDATVEREHGHFQIGSITPGFTFDFRNRTVNPTKGASFSFSCEFANPAMLSQDNDELTINYYKLINRNKFYIPMSRDVVIALSTAVGIQENLATGVNSEGNSEGYIPNIKVFRLVGADIVRGYEDSEINRLISNEDISEVEVNSRAYMANIKFEPRLMLSDSTVLGIFYDAGRIFVNEFKEDSLRSAVGVSFKYITPVGTLDFDYGIKLLRKRDADGTLDSPGRLHVSIGFF